MTSKSHTTVIMITAWMPIVFWWQISLDITKRLHETHKSYPIKRHGWIKITIVIGIALIIVAQNSRAWCRGTPDLINFQFVMLLSIGNIHQGCIARLMAYIQIWHHRRIYITGSPITGWGMYRLVSNFINFAKTAIVLLLLCALF